MEIPILSRAQWRKSSHSGSNGNCVEVARLADAIAVRDSKDADGPHLTFTSNDWGRFLAEIKN